MRSSHVRERDAQAARVAFVNLQTDLKRLLANCVSGRELIARGYNADVELAAQLDISNCAPVLMDAAYSKLTD